MKVWRKNIKRWQNYSQRWVFIKDRGTDGRTKLSLCITFFFERATENGKPVLHSESVGFYDVENVLIFNWLLLSALGVLHRQVLKQIKLIRVKGCISQIQMYYLVIYIITCQVLRQIKLIRVKGCISRIK